tara:strand:- start:671 stop:988 length:318 start_codon:yes stop_codon:yes gene_type:complete
LEIEMHQRKRDEDLQILGLDIWNGSAAQLTTFQTTTGATMPMLQQAGNPVYPLGMDVSTIAVVDKEGIVRGLYGEEDHVQVNARVDLIFAQAPLAETRPPHSITG